MDLFLKYSELSRADITKLTKISFPTVMKIVDYLLGKQILVEAGGTTSITDSKLGRKGQTLRLNADAYSTIGIHFEGNYLHIGLVNLAYGLLDQKAFPFGDTPEQADEWKRVSENMTDTIRQFRSLHAETTILGCCVALPGIVDGETMTVRRRNFEKAAPFGDAFPTFRELGNFPVSIENDMNAASYGELILRRSEDRSDLVYLALGTGFGSGIIMAGKIWRGAANFAGNLGTMLVSCAEGETAEQLEAHRLENQINIAAIRKRFGVDIRRDTKTPPETKAAIGEYLAGYLVPLVYNLSYVLDAANYVLAGVVTEYLGEVFFDQVNRRLQHLLTQGMLNPTACILPTVSKDAGIVGAAAIAFNRCIPDLLGDMV